jgi:hypothetical protein
LAFNSFDIGSPSVKTDDHDAASFAEAEPQSSLVGHGKEDPDDPAFYSRALGRLGEVARVQEIEQLEDLREAPAKVP